MPMVHVLESTLEWSRWDNGQLRQRVHQIVQLRQRVPFTTFFNSGKGSRTQCFSLDLASEVYRNHLLTWDYPHCLKLTRHVVSESSLLVGKPCPCRPNLKSAWKVAKVRTTNGRSMSRRARGLWKEGVWRVLAPFRCLQFGMKTNRCVLSLSGDGKIRVGWL